MYVRPNKHLLNSYYTDLVGYEPCSSHQSSARPSASGSVSLHQSGHHPSNLDKAIFATKDKTSLNMVKEIMLTALFTINLRQVLVHYLSQHITAKAFFQPSIIGFHKALVSGKYFISQAKIERVTSFVDCSDSVWFDIAYFIMWKYEHKMTFDFCWWDILKPQFSWLPILHNYPGLNFTYNIVSTTAGSIRHAAKKTLLADSDLC